MPTNRIEIVDNLDGTYDFKILAAENNNILAFSRQGYTHVTEAIDMAHRVTTAAVEPALTFTERAMMQAN
jgi:uncharacterized protein YegP (UPF0339 family)